MKPLAATVAALFVLVNAWFAAPVASAQQPPAPLPRPEQMLRLDVTSISPRVVTDSARTLMVTARVTNVSDQPLVGLKARVQLGARVAGATELSSALRGAVPTDAPLTLFEPVTPELLPGASADLSIVADLRSGLPFPEPGVYPLLVNVNGAPEGGGDARLAALNLLLPVRALPGGEPAQRPSEAQPLSVIWPIATKPRVVSDPVRGSVVLSDDTLADELRPGGRLHALVGAAADAKASGELLNALCFAVDPDLVSTVHAMTHGYRVRQGPSSVAGTGRADARAWLSSLRELLDGACVVPTPYAGADLPGLATRTADLATAAASRDSVLERILGVQPLPGAIWSTDALTDSSAQALVDADKDLVIANAGVFDGPRRSALARTVLVGDGGASELRALPFDAQTALALTPGSASKALGYYATVAADDTTVAAQSAVATVLFKALDVPGSEPMLLAPPQVWTAGEGELRWLLSTLSQLQGEGVVEAVGLSDLLDSGTDGTLRLAPGAPAASRLPGGVAEAVAGVDATVDDLAKAMEVDPSEQVEPAEITDPLRNALLRASSTAFADDSSARAGAVDDAEEQLDDVLRAVRVSDPGRTISLASGASPIPVSIANRLPVQVTVQVGLSNSAGLRPAAVSAVEVPAGRSRNLKIPAEALRAGRFTVDVELTTPGGTRWGDATRFELASTEYGSITVIVTATAAGALLLLAGRRIYRRVRANGAAPRA